MTEIYNPFIGLIDFLKRGQEFASDNSEPQTAEFLLELGRIENLVHEGRTPARYGTRGAVDEIPKIIYLVPPKGFKAEDMCNIHYEMDVLCFVNKLGVKRTALEFALTDEQAAEVESRVSLEMSKKDRSK